MNANPMTKHKPYGGDLNEFVDNYIGCPGIHRLLQIHKTNKKGKDGETLYNLAFYIPGIYTQFALCRRRPFGDILEVMDTVKDTKTIRGIKPVERTLKFVQEQLPLDFTRIERDWLEYSRGKEYQQSILDGVREEQKID